MEASLIRHPRYRTAIMITPEIRKELRDIQAHYNWNRRELAERLGLSETRMSTILNSTYCYVQRRTYNSIYPLMQRYLENATKPSEEKHEHVINAPSNPETASFLFGAKPETPLPKLDESEMQLVNRKSKSYYRRKPTRWTNQWTKPKPLKDAPKSADKPGFWSRVRQVFFP